MISESLQRRAARWWSAETVATSSDMTLGELINIANSVPPAHLHPLRRAQFWRSIVAGITIDAACAVAGVSGALLIAHACDAMGWVP